jgi:hypothetical protein
MKQDRLAELMQHEVNASRDLIEGAGGEVINHFIGESDEATYVVVSPWGSDQERTIMLAGIRAMFREKKVGRYLHVSEAWRGEDPGIQPSKDPGREECLIIVGVDNTTKIKRIRMFRIKRLANGRRLLEEEDNEEFTDFDGDSLRILDSGEALN